ncbi:hypothetical protein EWO26_19110 [Salmonella enterica]|nr:hypothetical protein [Salmonella enterica]
MKIKKQKRLFMSLHHFSVWKENNRTLCGLSVPEEYIQQTGNLWPGSVFGVSHQKTGMSGLRIKALLYSLQLVLPC